MRDKKILSSLITKYQWNTYSPLRGQTLWSEESVQIKAPSLRQFTGQFKSGRSQVGSLFPEKHGSSALAGGIIMLKQEFRIAFLGTSGTLSP